MRDEPTPTEQEPIDAIAAQLESFRKDPSELDLFRELRRTLKAAKRHSDLAELFELRAGVEAGDRESSRLWLDAAGLRVQSGDIDRALNDYREVLERSPAHDKAAQQAFDGLLAHERYAEAANVAEAEIEALEAQITDGGSATLTHRLAARCRAVARLWQDHLCRAGTALRMRAFWSRIPGG